MTSKCRLISSFLCSLGILLLVFGRPASADDGETARSLKDAPSGSKQVAPFRTTAREADGEMVKGTMDDAYKLDEGNYTLTGTDCPIGALLEGEPDCGLPEDTVNGGCNSVPPVFSDIACDETYCGTNGTSGDTRDTDWYRIVLAEDTEVTWSGQADHPFLIGIVNNFGVDSCDGVAAFVVSAIAVAGEPVGVSACLPAGTWYLFAAPSGFDGVPCGSEYTMTASCVPCSTDGACCFPDESCQFLSVGDCADAGGVHQGVGVSCGEAGDFCSTVGACCFPDTTCESLNVADCADAAGVHQGAGVSCDDAFCPIAPTNDFCVDRIPLEIPSLTGGTTLGSTFDDVGTCGTSNSAPGVWYSVMGTGTTITASTCGDFFDYDTKISVFCGTCEDLNCVVGNDDSCVGGESGLLSTVSWCSQDGVEYLILVHGFSDQVGSFMLELTEDGAGCVPDVLCIPIGACCFGDECVFGLTQAECEADDGTYLGDGTGCDAAAIVRESNPNTPIPDGEPAGITDTIEMGMALTVDDLNVGLQIDHTFVGDLCVTLEHNGTTVVLVARSGADTGEVCHFGTPFGCANDNYDLILDDEGTGGSIEDLCVVDMTSPPNYTPFEALDAFIGMNALGTWTISVSDNAGIDTGTFLGWSLLFADPNAPSVCAACPADVDDDGDVDFQDLLELLSTWSPDPDSCVGCPADIDGDGDVDFQDLLILLSTWGPCP